MSALEKAITICGSQSELARRIGGKVRTGHIHYWLRNKVPADRCADIEHATAGQVTRHDLRPDVFGDASAAGRQEMAHG
ncbi:YdaS family helix-turn-helix protein [Rhodanobacter sp. OR92]|uniref:transcriptional regulator n=1 Tax=Rhodanobacter sp. OR92 TaxID=1076524 RepID=UPI00055DFD16|nr:YdaS family helix-turn-helix protein [Rhodanobacter sp. OR92]